MALCNHCGQKIEPDAVPVAGPPRRRSRYEVSADGCRYTADEIEFMTAMDDFKRWRNRPFPTWSEVLAVVRSLGYRKVTEMTL